jgi:putative colanic acid biosynthesis glycosyltransferase
MPTLSIAIVTLNAKDTISKALESILHQTYKDYEIIVIDGKSEDGTVELLKEHKKHISVFVSEKDSGIYEAMNKALIFAKGEWIIFLGADDFFYSTSSLQEIFKNKNGFLKSDIVIGNFIFKNKKVRNYFNWRLLKGNSVNHQSVFYSQAVYKRFSYDTNYKLASDYKLNLILYLKKYTCTYIDSTIAVFSDHGLSNNLKEISLLESNLIRIEVLGKKIGFLINTLISLKNLVRKAL